MTASTEYSNIPENQKADLKSYFMKIIYSFKEDINNSLKEIQENTGKQVKELNKAIQDLKVEVETIKKNGGKPGNGKSRKEIGNYRCMYHQQNKRDRRENLRGRRYHRKHGHNNQRKCKMQTEPNSKYPGNPGHNE